MTVTPDQDETAKQDDRLKVHQGFAKLIRRPELASFFGVIAVFVLFICVAPAFRSLESFAEVLYVSSTLGIVALAVGLLSWSAEEVETRLQQIMSNIHAQCVKYGRTEGSSYINYMKGANVAGFLKVAKSMLAQGVL